MLVSSTFLALVLATPEAAAERIGKKPIDVPKGVSISVDGFVQAVVTIDQATAITAEITSDSGEETVVLTEADAWLHGTASGVVKSPSGTVIVDGDLVLTLYDEVSASLIRFSGTLDADGSISLTPEKPTLDIEVLAAELFPNADGSYDLGLDFSGADAYAIAYADVAITQGKTTTKAEIDFDELGAVWEGELTLDHEGLVEVKTKTYDKDGEKLESSKAKLGMPWDDGGYGVNALATDDDPLTSVALLKLGGNLDCDNVLSARCSAVTVVSTDWTSSTAPVSAEIDIEDGETLSVPANSYQVSAATAVVFSGSPEKESFQVTIDGTTVKEGSSFTDRGLCADGTCVALAQGSDGTWTLSATAYSETAAKLPRSVKVALASTLKAAFTKESSYTLTFDPEVAVVFANEVSLSGDPIGVDLSGKVSLLGAASSKGKQKTLAKGKFYGSFTRDEDGDLGLGGIDKDARAACDACDILIGGEPIDFERTDTNKDGVIEAPPVIVYKVDSNGKGTRAAATTSNGSPGLL